MTEAASDYDFTGSFEYKRPNGSQYMYDANGSLVADKSRGIAYITYDANGNPNRIYFTNGSQTRYLYCSSGWSNMTIGDGFQQSIINVSPPFP